MIFTDPMPFQAALDSAEVRSIMPTTGGAADVARLSGDIKRRALWSARVTSVEHLQKLSDLRDAILEGKIDQATARLQIKELLAEQGYAPDPDQAGGLQDLSSDRRINLQLETNVDVARGAGWYEEGQDPVVLDAFPAQELIDTAPGGDAKKRRDWAARWAVCGGRFFDGRMIAPKDDPIWQKLGDPSLFADGLGNDWAPFAYNSAWRLRDIAREEAVALGVLGEDTVVAPQPLDLNAELQAKPDVRDDWLRTALTDSGLGHYDAEGVYHFEEGSNG
jgi:hypothetical protein